MQSPYYIISFCLFSDCDEYFLDNSAGALTEAKINVLRHESIYVLSIIKCANESKWTTIQRRVDDTVSFYRPWADYVAGFGDLYGNYWMGLDNIHSLTIGSRRLRIYLESFEAEDDIKIALYSNFTVGDALSNYKLSVSGFTGTVGDSFLYHNNNAFSTYDKDNDAHGGHNCALVYTAGWWYKSCHNSNLNGAYLTGLCEYAKGASWLGFKGHDYSLKTIIMAIQ